MEWILHKQRMKMETEFNWFWVYGPVIGFCKPVEFHKSMEFLNQLSNRK